MEFADNTDQDEQPYKYNGKELDKMHGLNIYDYSERYMEPTIGRFTGINPLTEKYYSISPYAYVGNNPLKYIDPTGAYWVDNKSRDYTFNLRKDMYNKIGSLENDRTKKVAAVLKDLKERKNVEDSKFAEINDLFESINDLWQRTAELIQMGVDQDQSFQYTMISEDVG